MPARALALALALVALLAVSASPAAAYEDPAGCPTEVTYDPTIPTFDSVVGRPLGEGGTGTTPRNPSQKLYDYFDAMVAHTVDHPRVKVVRKDFGFSVLGKPLRFYVISSRDNIENLDTGRADAKFWEGVKDGSISEADAVAAAPNRPALGWITATPHGNEPAAGEAISRMLYELAARTDCWNLRRLNEMDLFLMPVRNPDGRDAPPGGVRTSAWAFDHNRDFGTQNQSENATFLPLLKRYPGLFFIDAHQQGTGYFFPPNEDPVLHEISNFSLDFIQNKIGPALQQKFNDQNTAYRNYNTYDLFVPEYGDSVPTLLSGAAGMTFEKGTNEIYGKQVYDHYLAIDETVNVTVRDKDNILRDWAEQWQEAVDQGAACILQPNKLVSPLRPTIEREVPVDLRICGYFYRPDNHAGDAAELIRHMRRQGVHVYRFDTAASLAGVREFGAVGAGQTATLPAGTLYIPMAQPLKHWIQAVLGEDPFQPINLFYDVSQWSYSLQRGQTGNGYLTSQPMNVAMTEIDDPRFGTAPAAGKAVYAFDTDSMRGLALVAELLDAGVTVYRGRDAFDAAGKHFETGAALVDGSTLGTFDLSARSDARQTPISALDAFPVARYRMQKPKIGLYSNAAISPAAGSPQGTEGTPLILNSPMNPDPQAPLPGHCGSQRPGAGSGTIYCQALFTLTDKIGLPESMIVPLHAGDVRDGDLVSQDITAFINPSATITIPTMLPRASDGVLTVQNAPAGQAQLQEFVNQGGIYIGQLTGGLTTARNAGLTTLDTTTIPGLRTPGSFFSAVFDTANPVAWGFDRGGWIYRESTNDPVFASVPAGAAAAVRFANPLKSFGYTENALGEGQLPGRAAVVDQPFGEGHSILVGFDAFFRAWREQDERLILNAVLYPAGEVIAAPGRRVTAADEPLPGQPAADTPARAVAESKLPAVGDRPLRAVERSAGDVRIRVARRDGATLRRAVRSARLPNALRRKVRWISTRRSLTLVVKQVRTEANTHDRGVWVGRIITPLKKRGVRIQLGQL